MSYKAYSIMAPPFDVTSGGVRVMWGLYGALLAKGQIVHVNAKYADPDFIAIYPEIIQGNPLEANHVVRYILNKPGVMGLRQADGTFEQGPTEFGEKDQLWYFSRLFGDSPTENYMFLPIINTHVFYDQKKLRTKTAYFVGKGQDTIKHPVDAILIDRKVAADQSALADLLNECSVLYCYDPVTAMTEIARLCGCRVVVVPSAYTMQEFEKYEPGLNGISWGDEKEVPLDSEVFREHYMKMKEEFDWKLDAFIEQTQKL